MRSLLFTLAMLSLACTDADKAAPAPQPEPEAMKQAKAAEPEIKLNVEAPTEAKPSQRFAFNGPLDYCDLFTCKPCRSGVCPPGGVEVSYCCDSSGTCREVGDGVNCPSGQFKVICQWGQTNTDGTFTCYDT